MSVLSHEGQSGIRQLCSNDQAEHELSASDCPWSSAAVAMIPVLLDVVVPNGGSSSGKTEVAVRLQEVLPGHGLRLGVDTLIDAAPASLSSEGGIDLEPADGVVRVGPAFRALENAWMHGIAAIARAGARVIVDDVLLGGAASQARWQSALDGLDVLWVAVRCAPAVAAERESTRGDRVAGMAESQALAVHRRVVYDFEVDTTRTTAVECAWRIAERVRCANSVQ